MSSVAHPELADLLTQKNVQRNLSTPKLVEAAVRNGEGILSARGALVSETGKRTGRSPKINSPSKTQLPRTRSRGVQSICLSPLKSSTPSTSAFLSISMASRCMYKICSAAPIRGISYLSR